MPANNLVPLIRRFNAPDRELGLNNLELEGRNAAEVSSLDKVARPSRRDETGTLRKNRP